MAITFTNYLQTPIPVLWWTVDTNSRLQNTINDDIKSKPGATIIAAVDS